MSKYYAVVIEVMPRTVLVEVEDDGSPTDALCCAECEYGFAGVSITVSKEPVASDKLERAKLDADETLAL